MRKMHLLGDLFLLAGLSFVVAAAVAARPDTAGRAVEGGRLPNGATARLGTTRLRHGDGLVFAAYVPDGRSLVTASKDKTVRLWDLATGREVRRFVRGGTPPARDVPSPGAGRNGAAAGGGPMTANSVLIDPIDVAALSRDGSRIAVAEGRSVCLWEKVSGTNGTRIS
jgi:WD40 repeat protein